MVRKRSKIYRLSRRCQFLGYRVPPGQRSTDRRSPNCPVRTGRFRIRGDALVFLFLPYLPDKVLWVKQKPLVIGIYPSDGFGPLRRDGLHAILDNYSDELIIFDLSYATTQEMKHGQIERIITKLKELLAQDNVLAIVGPPVTEATRRVLETVANSGKKVTIFLESAGPPTAIGWDKFQRQLPIFRLIPGWICGAAISQASSMMRSVSIPR